MKKNEKKFLVFVPVFLRAGVRKNEEDMTAVLLTSLLFC
jgi:hypothetical protein